MSDTCTIHSVNSELVKELEKKLEDPTVLMNMTTLYKMFGDLTRLRILDILIHNEVCVCELEELLTLSQSLISHQLKKLKDTNIVKTRKDGKRVYYSLKDEHVKGIYLICRDHIKNC